ncbi:DUF3667 domain-containing protein [Microbulbifer sp. CAU 1566]|uniref:DUF3667 domain-containing protein n=1 Tax=Microbulbifer sp. CAU 1566 TaxID=2933269 RepID=UPI002006A09F|nr:DUF3667 domain-containing protein [Microbulbifer sp. CAU 1566]MCK7596498.1 DUF3667 domain-containing protein [Microbulbifer sp. CAU 1566]
MSDLSTPTAQETSTANARLQNSEASSSEVSSSSHAPEIPDAHAHCANCTAPLLGPHCYACGQPSKGLVRELPEMLGDFLNSVFCFDSRITRTLGPLLYHPGFLTNEYLAGRRARYVSPVRLFVFLCLTAFFAANLSSDWGSAFTINQSTTSEAMGDFDLKSVEHSISAASSVDEVLRLRELAIEEIAEAARESGDLPGVSGLLNGVEQIIRHHADQRIAQLDPAAVERLAENHQEETPSPQIDGTSSAIDAWFVRQSARLTMNISRIEKDPNLLKDALFGSIPSALFIMLPIFALCLSLLYLFKRRLYMEHLIVALHSHAFLSLALLLAVLLFDLRAWLTEPHTLPQALFNLALVALALWVPVYLLLMQKWVYRQGWPMTLFKYSLLSVVYLLLLSMATTIAGLTSVANF